MEEEWNGGVMDWRRNGMEEWMEGERPPLVSLFTPPPTPLEQEQEGDHSSIPLILHPIRFLLHSIPSPFHSSSIPLVFNSTPQTFHCSSTSSSFSCSYQPESLWRAESNN
eukprot:3099663-Pyramimonas_sp.AAC.1